MRQRVPDRQRAPKTGGEKPHRGDYQQKDRRRGGTEPGATAVAGIVPIASARTGWADGCGFGRSCIHRQQEIRGRRTGLFAGFAAGGCCWESPQRAGKFAETAMNIAQRILTALIRAYQAVLSPALGAFFGPSGTCRYTPSCSHYALDAVRVHGALGGSWLAVRRVCRCNP